MLINEKIGGTGDFGKVNISLSKRRVGKILYQDLNVG